MPSIDNLHRTVDRKRKELSDLQNKKARESKNISELESKVNSDKKRISQTKSTTTIRNKQRNIKRNNGKLSDSYKNLSSIENRIGRKAKDLKNEEKRLQEQETKERKRKMKEEERHQKDLEKNMGKINSSLTEHELKHEQTEHEIAELKDVPEKINILFITSSPKDQDQLSPDEEVREIENMIRKSEYRESISFHTKWAARPLDIIQHINEVNPTIIHFSGHGSAENELAFQDDNGHTKIVTKEAIVQTISSSSDQVRLVFFSSCFTDEQARELVNYIDATIGMISTINDNSAIIFAAQFYSSIGFGYSVSKAFQQAKSALMLEETFEEDIPTLYTNDELDSDEMILVNPS